MSNFLHRVSRGGVWMASGRRPGSVQRMLTQRYVLAEQVPFAWSEKASSDQHRGRLRRAERPGAG